MEVVALNYYPVKSCAGTRLKKAEILKSGLKWDRFFMVVDAENRFISQRNTPKMALITPSFNGDLLTLEAPSMPKLSIAVTDDGPAANATIWNDTCKVVNIGQKANEWFSAFLEKPCTLVKMEETFSRKLDPDYALDKTNHTFFADGYPILLMTQNSLDDLNQRLEQAIPANRFRANILIRGAQPYADDHWKKIKIGPVVFSLVKPCARCTVTTINQQTLEKAKEPLKTLAGYRKNEKGGVLFGQNLIPHNTGSIAIGDAVEIIE